ncbi:ABC transporter permease [Lentilactobacillus kosonis]|uniref:ABC transporter, permease protein n=1 Tax=Lentilactobacillus kosonis TaxID=2810561 RepID=A0A401FHN5_9LACO|nr:ABC transporter permease [Lentilactobacillus kosonis]GAY71875.1 ABC transporter, permease protein [Lentilactobacillus kosonis]
MKSNLQHSFSIGIGKNILDLWVIGGTLAITAITTSQSSLGQMIADREKGQLGDLIMTGIETWKLQFSYLTSAFVISWLMQIGMLILMAGYFALSDGMQITWASIPAVMLICALSSLTWTSFNLLCLAFVRRVETFGRLSSIIAAAAGFFAGVYVPISSVPDSAQWLMKLTPAPYDSALFRQILMGNAINNKFAGKLNAYQSTFKTKMGVNIRLQHTLNINETILIMLGFTILFGLVSLLVARRTQKSFITRV